MNDPPGVPSPLGIEVVEWFSEGGENLTVRVTGRWRRRRPAWSAQPTLVIEAPGRRYRFPAMPEPPSLTGTPPGMWRISFAVPAALAPDLGGRAWLQFGAVVVPLPAAVEPMNAGAPPGEPAVNEAEPGVSEASDAPVGAEPSPAAEPSERTQPSLEVEAESERRRAAEAQTELAELSTRMEGLERDLAQAREEAGRLSNSLALEEQQRRSAEQRAHAERAQRLDLTRQLGERTREAERSRQALGDLAAAEERIRQLERQLTEARRRIDEAEQLAAAATSARERAERKLAEAGPATAGPEEEPDSAERARLGVEQALVAQRASDGERVPAEPAVPAAESPVPAAQSAPALAATPVPVAPPDAAAEALIAALRAELNLRTGAEAALRSRLVESEARLAAREHLERRTGTTLSQLRGELDGLRGAISRERAARDAAERQVTALEGALESQQERTREASAAIGELRLALESLRAEALPGGAPEPVIEVEPEPEALIEREPEPEALVQPEPEPLIPPEAPPEPVAPPEPEPVAPPEPEPVAPPEPEALVDAEPPAEANAEPAAETEPAVPAAEDPPEPASVAKIAAPPVEPEPGREPEPEPPEPEPAPAPDPEPQAEAEVELAQPEGPVDLESQRLSEALIRLKELIAPIDPSEAETPRPVPALGDRAHQSWLKPAFKSLARSDPEDAGRLLVGLMAAQGTVRHGPIAYDIVLGEGQGCAQVTVYEGQRTRVTFEEEPRSADEVAFRLVGDYAEVARLFTAGWLRRRLHLGVARVRGKQRKQLTAIPALLDTDLGLSGLVQAGVLFAPRTSLMLLSRVIEPSWTVGVRFAVAYSTPAGPSSYLLIGDGDPVQVADSAPEGHATTTVTGPPGSLELVLAGTQDEGVVVAGDEWMLTSLRKWVKRAQSG